MILTLLFSIVAFADCKNLIDKADVDKMLAGLPHGKTVLKCLAPPCECIDGIVFEISKRDKDGKIIIDQDKKNARDLALAAEALAEEKRKEDLEYLKNKDTYTQQELEQAIKLLLKSNGGMK